MSRDNKNTGILDSRDAYNLNDEIILKEKYGI